MKKLHRVNVDQLILEERLKALQEFELDLVEQGRVPDARKLMIRRLRGPLEFLGGAVLSTIVSMLALFAVFVIVTKTLHL